MVSSVRHRPERRLAPDTLSGGLLVGVAGHDGVFAGRVGVRGRDGMGREGGLGGRGVAVGGAAGLDGAAVAVGAAAGAVRASSAGFQAVVE